MTKRAFRGTIVAAVVPMLATTLVGQRPEREQEVKLPGLDVVLKAGWQLLFHDGCRFAVPLGWQPDASGAAAAPDGSNITVRMFTVASWAAHKDQIKTAFGSVSAIHEDGARRLWLEIGDRTRVQHYIDVWNPTGVCSALLELRGAEIWQGGDLPRRVADSIGVAPTAWSPDPFD